MGRTAASLLLASLCAACAEVPEPRPHPVEIERLLASLATCGAACQDHEVGAASDPKAADRFAEKVNAVDRLVPALERIPADKIDPSLAAALIVR